MITKDIEKKAFKQVKQDVEFFIETGKLETKEQKIKAIKHFFELGMLYGEIYLRNEGKNEKI